MAALINNTQLGELLHACRALILSLDRFKDFTGTQIGERLCTLEELIDSIEEDM